MAVRDVLLLDILQIEDQHPDVVNNMINFYKRHILFRAITYIQSYQQIKFNLQPVHQIATFLKQFPQKNEEELRDLSFKCEPGK
jgi:glycine hydroxymethyltransferase/Rap guanine nucleotide exchange factor 1